MSAELIVTALFMAQWLGLLAHSIAREFSPMQSLLNRLATDQRTLAERKWRESAKPATPQQACDVALFSDDSKQKELFTWTSTIAKSRSR